MAKDSIAEGEEQVPACFLHIVNTLTITMLSTEAKMGVFIFFMISFIGYTMLCQ